MSHQIESEIAIARKELDALIAAFEQRIPEFQKVQQACSAALERKEALGRKLDELNAEVEGATADFKAEFEAANYERTSAVKKTLNRKNDALSMVEELTEAMQKVERQIPLLRMEGGPEARHLRHAHSAIKKAYAKLRMLEAIATVPQEFKDALLLATEQFSEDRELDFVWRGLADAAKAAGVLPAVPIEPLSVVPFTHKDFNWTPAQVHKARASLLAGAAPDTIKPERVVDLSRAI